MRGGENFSVTDLPGMYALTPHSADERAAVDALMRTEGVILQIIDAVALERSLHLTAALASLHRPMVLALNMADELARRGVRIDVHTLTQLTGLPAFPISARRGEGIDALLAGARHAPVPRGGFDPRAVAAASIATTQCESRDDRIDRIVLRPYVGLPLVLLSVAAALYLSFGGVGMTLKAGFDALLDACIRDDLGEKAARVMAVLHPLKVVLTNWDADKTLTLTVENHPKHPEMGSHTVTFGKELYIEQEDFMEVPAKKFQRMYPGFEVRLNGAYIVKCEGCKKDENGNVTEVYCTVDMDSLSGSEGADRKIKGKTLHWVSAADAVPFEARLYDPLLADDSALEDETGPTAEDAVDAEETEEAEEADANLSRADYDFLKKLNQHSLTVVRGVIEPYAKECAPGTALQFLRMGYFCKDPDSTAELPVFNRTVGLRDAFAKAAK